MIKRPNEKYCSSSTGGDEHHSSARREEQEIHINQLIESIQKKDTHNIKLGKGIWHLVAFWIHFTLIISTLMCVSNTVKSSSIHHLTVNFFKFPSTQPITQQFMMTSGRFFVSANDRIMRTESLIQQNLDLNVTFSITMNNFEIHPQQLLTVSSNEEILFNASTTQFPSGRIECFWKISNGDSLLDLLTSNPVAHTTVEGYYLKINANDLLPSIPYNLEFIVRQNSSDNTILGNIMEKSFSFIMERKPKSNVIAQINGGLHEEYLPIHSYYNSRTNINSKETDFGIIQPDGSLQLISTSYDPENLPLVGFIKESFNWSCFYVKGHSYKANTIDQLRSDISSSQLQPCTETRVKTESYYNIQTSNLDYSTTYIICHDYSVGTRSDTTFIMLRTLNINEYWSVRIFPSIESMFMDPTKAIVLSGEIFPGGVVLSGITSLKWEWTVSYLGREDQEESPTLVMSSSNSVLYLEPRTLLSNEKAYSSSPNIYEFSVRAIINQQYTVNSTFRRKVASKQQDSIIDSSSDISIYPLFVGHNRPMLDEFVIELPSIISSAVSAKYDIYYSIDGNAMKLLTSSTYVKKITTWLPYSHTNQIDIHIFLQINDPFKESQNFRYWIGTKNVKFNNTDYDHLKMTLSKTHQIQQLVNMLPNITDIMEKNNMKYFDPRIIQDIYLELDKVCTTLNELYESSITFNSSYEELIREEISRIAISARDQIQTLNSSNSFALALFDHFNMDSNLIQLIVSLSKKPMYLSTISISLIVDNLLHPLLINFLKERNIFITRTIDVIDMRPIRETNNPTVEFSTLFSTYSNYFLTILDSLLSTSSANTIIVKSQVLAGFCQKWIHQLSLRLVEESAPSTAITITNNNVEISYKRDLLSSLIGAGFGEGASVSVDYSNDTREWKVNNNLLLIQLPPEIRQQSLFISDTELDSETVPSSSERNHFSNFIDASIISPLPLNITDQFVGFKIVTFKNTEGNSEILGNVMISVELLYNQQSLKLRNLKSPIEMVFFADQSVYLPNYLWMGGGCHFWNETTEEWSKEGCTTVASYSFLGNSKPKGSLITDDSNPGLNRIYCSCNHTTLFAVLKANTSDVELIQDFTNKVWGDITSCILIFIFSIGQAIFLLSIRTPHNISLKFRGFIPFFSILVLILEALINLARDGMVMNIFLTGVEIPFMDTIDGALRTVIDPLYCAMLVLYMLNIWQYYHKERFQYLMKKYQEKDEKYSIRRYVKFTSRSYLVMPCLALYAAQLVTYIILLVLASVSVLNFKLVFTIFSLLRACIIALSVLVSFSIIIFMEIFMKKVLNFNDVKTDNFLKFEGTFNGDVFLFKIEWIAYMFMASLLVLAEGYDVMNVMYPNLYSNTFNEGSLAFQLYSRQAHIHMLEIAPIILLFMVKVLILLVYGGFVACMTARKHTFCCTRGSETQNTSDSELLDVVNDPVLGPLFEFYAMKEFTLPLVYLYRQLIDIYSFEGNFHQSMFERSQHVRKIYKRFLKKYSPFPLSISRKTMRMFHIRKEQDEAITAQELEDLITILKVETTEQLMGVYWRFKQTETFKKNEKKSVVNPYLNEDL